MAGPPAATGFSPSATSRSRELGPGRSRSILCKLQLGLVPDFKFELLPLHSPLLRQSLLVSFPPLIDMLKFSGYSRLIRGRTLEMGFVRAWGHQGGSKSKRLFLAATGAPGAPPTLCGWVQAL